MQADADAARQDVADVIARIEAEGGVEALRTQAAAWTQKLEAAQRQMEAPTGNNPVAALLVQEPLVRDALGDSGAAHVFWQQTLSVLYAGALTVAQYLTLIEAAHARIAEEDGASEGRSDDDLLRSQEAAFVASDFYSYERLMSAYRHLLDHYGTDAPDAPMGRFFAYLHWLVERFGTDEALRRLGLKEPAWDPVAQRQQYEMSLIALREEVDAESADRRLLEAVYADGSRDTYEVFMPARYSACCAPSEYEAVVRVLQATIRRMEVRVAG